MPDFHHWTAAEDAALRARYGHEPTASLAASLSRSKMSVSHRARALKLRHPKRWTPEEDAQLRAGWGKQSSYELARQLGRGRSSVKARAFQLGLDAKRCYTDDEIALVRELYPTHTAAQIAERLYGAGRAALGIHRLAHKLGLRKCPGHPPELIEQVRALHAEGLNDVEIGQRVGMGRDQIHAIRYERLKLPPNAEAVKAANRRGVQTQRQVLGIEDGGDLRRLGYRRFAAANGWPEDLRPREVQILNVLAEQGPKTLMELAVALNTRTDRIGTNGRPVLLAGNGKGGTYAASLAQRGLVYIQKRWTKGRGHGKSRLPNLYLLTPQAIQIREEILRARGAEKET